MEEAATEGQRKGIGQGRRGLVWVWSKVRREDGVVDLIHQWKLEREELGYWVQLERSPSKSIARVLIRRREIRER